jgi:hypothetical protein
MSSWGPSNRPAVSQVYTRDGSTFYGPYKHPLALAIRSARKRKDTSFNVVTKDMVCDNQRIAPKTVKEVTTAIETLWSQVNSRPQDNTEDWEKGLKDIAFGACEGAGITVKICHNHKAFEDAISQIGHDNLEFVPFPLPPTEGPTPPVSSSQHVGPSQDTLGSLLDKVEIQPVAERHRHGQGDGEERYYSDPGGPPVSDQGNDEVSDDDESVASAK